MHPTSVCLAKRPDVPLTTANFFHHYSKWREHADHHFPRRICGGVVHYAIEKGAANMFHLFRTMVIDTGGAMQEKVGLHTLAKELKQAQDHCQQIELFSSRLKDFNNADAYAVANIVHEMRMNEGALPVGRKIGFTNPQMWSIYGVREPIWGYVYDKTVVRQKASNVQCNIGQFAEPKIEPEIVVHFRSTPPANPKVEDILACVDWIAHGIEIVQSHFPNWDFQAADAIADGGLHAILIVGEPQEVRRLGPDVISDLETFTVTLSCDGQMREQGRGSNALGNPLKSVTYLADLLATQPHASPLQAGELVTTGTLTAALPIEPGQTWSTELDGIALPGISVSFDM
jgi:2-keto-4-pentenoate hydratase